MTIRIKAAIIAFAMAVGVIVGGYGMTSVGHGPNSNSIFNDYGTRTVQAWSFDNKNRKNKKPPTVHHGLW